jgi:hypothetical protein
MKKKKEQKKEHECTRFKTVLKRNKIREIVACRECGKQRNLIVKEE